MVCFWFQVKYAREMTGASPNLGAAMYVENDLENIEACATGNSQGESGSIPHLHSVTIADWSRNAIY